MHSCRRRTMRDNVRRRDRLQGARLAVGSLEIPDVVSVMTSNTISHLCCGFNAPLLDLFPSQEICRKSPSKHSSSIYYFIFDMCATRPPPVPLTFKHETLFSDNLNLSAPPPPPFPKPPLFHSSDHLHSLCSVQIKVARR